MPEDSKRTRPITDAKTILAVYTQDWGLFATRGAQLIACIWEDGYSVWSKNRIEGGPPYCCGTVEAAKVQTLLYRLHREGIFTHKQLSRPNFGPDSQFTTILLKADPRRLKMESWHELYERNPGTVDTAVGIQHLEGESREAVLKRQPKDYQRYRAAWDHIRKSIAEALPRESKPVIGHLVMLHGVVSWDEGAVGNRPARKSPAQ